MNKHKWYNEIVAWAEGKTIQYKATNGIWKDCNFINIPPSFNGEFEFRVKPNTVKFRLYECKCTFNLGRHFGFTYANNDKEVVDQTNIYENDISFIKWITDWIEIEVGDTE
jgi:hypothetical protein